MSQNKRVSLPGMALLRRTAKRRTFMSFVVAMLGTIGIVTGVPAIAQGESFPHGTVTFVVPFPAGGNLDVFARTMGRALADIWQVPVVVENKPGAGGMIGADRVAKAREDGQTLLFTNTSVIQAPALYGHAPYDPFRDLTPVTQLGTVAIAFAIRSSSPIKDINSYLQTVKAEPNRHAYSSYGVGSSAHLLMEGLKDRYGLNLTHVAYKGEGPAMQDVLANQIEGGFFSERLAAAQQKAGNVRVLAVTGLHRSSILPDTPTFAEAGVPGMDTVGWYGVLAPKNTPPALALRLSHDFNKIMQRPEIQSKMRDFVIHPTGTMPDAFGRLMESEYGIWRGLVTKFGIKAE